MNGDFLDFGDVLPIDIFLNDGELRTWSSRTTLWTTFMVGRTIVPCSKSFAFDGISVTGWFVGVGEGHEVGCDGGLVGVF